MLTLTTPQATGKQQAAFSVTLTLGKDRYTVSPLAIDPSIGSRAFRFEKQTGDRAEYDLHEGAFGLQCECLGFLRWQHCKHVDSIETAGLV